MLFVACSFTGVLSLVTAVILFNDCVNEFKILRLCEP